MTVKQNHPHVSPNGQCFLPYLREWTDRSNLLALVEITSSVFSIEPPLFSKPAGPTLATPTPSPSLYSNQSSARSNFSPHPTAAVHGTTASPATAAYSTAGAYETYSAARSSPVTTGAAAAAASGLVMQPIPANGTAIASHSASTSTSLRAEEEKRLQLVDQVTMRLYEAIDTKQRTLRDQLDAQIALGGTLDQSATAAQKTLQDLRQSKTMYTEALAAMTEKNCAFEAWLAAESDRPPLAAVDRLVPQDPLSAQIVRLNADVNAIDDAFYYLERALASSRNSSVDLNTFLRECRSLARRQFLARAHLRKIAAAQLQQEADHVAQQARQAPVPQASAAGYPQSQPLAHPLQSQTQTQPQAQYHYQYPQAVHAPAPAPAASFGPYSAVPYPTSGYP